MLLGVKKGCIGKNGLNVNFTRLKIDTENTSITGTKCFKELTR